MRAEGLVISGEPLPPGLAARIGGLRGVSAVALAGAGRVRVNGAFANVIGVDPALPARFMAARSARSASLWNVITAGGIVVSGLLARQDQLAQGESLRVEGSSTVLLPAEAAAEVGIAGVDAAVSAAVARRVGIPVGNAIIVRAPDARLAVVTTAIKQLVPRSAAVVPLAELAPARPTGEPASPSTARQAGPVAAGPGMSLAQIETFLAAAKSRVGMPYVWGADGPDEFGCSGLVQWSMAQAGIMMPRVAVDQARTGPRVPIRRLQPGDLLFYREDPAAPDAISHVAVYIGSGQMLQAPAPGLDVEIVAAEFGTGFAWAVRVHPRLAARVASGY